ncbi:S1C family serine protease [Oceanirhabdus sp. W0125-5]|uniref:S1C family serine protease n=1 Tax=Oceanirhabdus sp. W0125-5 TaxID=2999116 RepID=UPI0022F3050C|nr:trypsin-like peptidase domain-containing protein [Oceanirhabdus sp. W0125-5]WBW96269.1 trypsin-like peptidase domain-containing protein [Oceanirhabdus sp. W0125-5]
MRKKILTATLLLALTISSLTGCGGNLKNSNSTDSNDTKIITESVDGESSMNIFNTQDYSSKSNEFDESINKTADRLIKAINDKNEDEILKIYSKEAPIYSFVPIDIFIWNGIKFQSLSLYEAIYDNTNKMVHTVLTGKITYSDKKNKEINLEVVFDANDENDLKIMDLSIMHKDEVDKKVEEVNKKAEYTIEQGGSVNTIDTVEEFVPDDVEERHPSYTNVSSLTLKEIIKLNDIKTVAILADTKKGISIGSGFFVKDGIIVTNYHVIEGCSKAKVRMVDGTLHEVDGVVAAHKTLDIAVLKLKNQIGISPIELGDVSEMEKGDNVVAIGSPKGLYNTVSTGIVSNLINDGKRDLIQISVPITHGNSGGPLFNQKGQVIGINSQGYEGGGMLNFAISVQHIEKIVNTLESAEFDEIKIKPLEQFK